MEVSGYPHYENVCSNILKFYFDPKGDHGLGDLLLTAFLRLAGKPELEIPEGVSISREYVTDHDKRIDLVIDCATFTLGIENKIYHWEANDFEIYARALAALAENKEVIKAVLCLRVSVSEPPPKGGFVRHTYRDLWSHVRDLLGHYLPGADPKWTIYLNEFMETTTRLAGETPDEKEITNFFIDHHDVIEQLVADRQRLLSRCGERVRAIEAGLQAFPETTKYLSRRWIYQGNCLASHFHILGATIGMDLVMDLKGWTLTLFQLPRPTSVLAQLIVSPEIAVKVPKPTKQGERYVVERWDLHANEIDLQEAMISWFKALIAAADALSPPPQAHS